MKRFTLLSLLVAVVLSSLLVVTPASAESVIVKCQRPCTAMVQAVELNGGRVTNRYRYVNAIAAEVPDAALAALYKVVEPGAVRKDLIVAQPTVASDRRAGGLLLAEASAEGATALGEAELASLAAAQPDAYVINNVYMNLGPVHGAGFTGLGQRVAVIDTGIRPGFPHISVDGSVIGGEDLVGDGLGYSNFANNGHGTFVAGMISANVVFGFSSTSALLKAVKSYCPTCVISPNQIPMIGSAPLSSIYALRVFGPSGGAPESRIIAAMERVLELRENYDLGSPETKDSNDKYNALHITVCNMSLGGATLYAGRDIEDELTQAFLDRDVVLVTSAGNAGPSGSTGGSPGTGFGSLTVGASSSAVHERILMDLQYGPGVGALYRPFGEIQTAYFSSRGPTADGRSDIEVVANGFASYGQGFSSSTLGISIGSGTSFSAPSVAGVAAVLRQAVPSATARQVRNALTAAANPAMIGDGSGPLDRGRGYVDAAAALQLLQSGKASDAPGAVGGDNKNVKVNILQGAGIKTYDGNVTLSAKGLLPGQRFDVYYRVNPNRSAVVVTLSGVKPGAVQNVFFGDDILLAVHSAKTSAIGEGDYKVFAFTTGGTFVIPNPELGLMRVTLNGDWTNASPIDATVNIFSVTDPIPGFTSQSGLSNGELKVYPFNVAAGATTLSARLEWEGDWANYPANDIDLILVRPNGTLILDGATLNNPEQATVSNPPAGNWLALVDGYSIFTKNGDRFKLRLAVDGYVLK
jgi:hypothetical protein